MGVPMDEARTKAAQTDEAQQLYEEVKKRAKGDS
jgi:hypothetical protein